MVILSAADTLRVGDVLSISIMGRTDYSEEAVVQEDGTVYTQLAGSVPASGLSIDAFRDTLANRLSDFYKDPVVLVAIENISKPQILISGRVASPGPVAYTRGMTLSQAITAAGGTLPDAKSSDILLRTRFQGKWASNRVNLDRVLSGQEQDPKLHPGDMVIVPKRFSLCTLQNLNVVATLISLTMSGLTLYYIISGR